MRIRKKITITSLILIIIPIIVISYVFLKNGEKTIANTIYNELLISRDNRAFVVNTYLKDIEGDIDVISRDDRVVHLFTNSDSVETGKLDDIFSFFVRSSIYNNIKLTDRNGMLIYSYKRDISDAYLHERHPFFTDERLQDPNFTHFYEIYTYNLMNRKTESLIVGDQIRANGSVVGYVTIEMDMEAFFMIISDTTSFGKSSETLIARLDKDSQIVFSTPLKFEDRKKLSLKIGDSIALPAQLSLQGKSGIGLSKDYRGVDIIAAWKPLENYNWGLVSKVDVQEVFEPIYTLQKRVFLIALITVIIVIIVSIIISRGITSPIIELMKNVKKVGKGHFEHDIVISGDDEVSILSKSFIEMIDDLKQSTASIDELEVLTKELEHSNNELEQFAYVASHDLKSPIKAIESLVLWLSEDLEDVLNDENREYIRLLNQRVKRMEKLLDDLLEFSRIGRVDKKVSTVNLSMIIDSIKELLVIPDTMNITYHNPIAPFDSLEVPLTLILRNLINNSIKHHDKNEGKIDIYTTDEGDFIKIQVIDDGPGIPEEFFEKAFAIFQTLRPRDEVEGSGIGLSVVKKSVEVVGGVVSLVPNTPRGLEVCILWPKVITKLKIDNK